MDRYIEKYGRFVIVAGLIIIALLLKYMKRDKKEEMKNEKQIVRKYYTNKGEVIECSESVLLDYEAYAACVSRWRKEQRITAPEAEKLIGIYPKLRKVWR